MFLGEFRGTQHIIHSNKYSVPRTEDGDERVILMALRQAADSIGGMSELARRSGLTREAVYKALGPDGNPRFSSLLAILQAFQLSLRVTHKKAE